MALLTKSDILKADDLKKEKIEVKEWGGHVFIRSMTSTERDAIEQSLYSGEGEKVNTKGLRARLLSLTIVDDKNKRLFDEKDMRELGKKNAQVLSKLFEVAQKLSGMTAEDKEALAKN